MLQQNWFLEGYFGGHLGRIPVNSFPFQIGRQSGIDFTVPSGSASRIHAEITQDSERLYLRDNNSTNGTFVNRKKLENSIELQHGDVLHFADFEVRLIKEAVQPFSDFSEKAGRTTIVFGHMALSDRMPAGVRELQELLEKKMIIPAFQPIIESGTEAIHAYELLGRGVHPRLSRSPGPLFHIAESFGGLAVQLSQLFRDVGVSSAATFDTKAKFFLNIHPDELHDIKNLLLQMEQLRKQHPHLSLVLEIHEKAASKLDDMKMIRKELDNINIELAYDDFGAGQGRLMELIEAPAHYLKFDISLVREIDKAPETKREMVQALVSMAKKMNTLTLAEGIETAEEMRICWQMGFDYIQGYYYGKPKEGAL
jgi:EAL domain-containing protein (putative c-di-GMP-specific phosphodiesterase class I)